MVTNRATILEHQAEANWYGREEEAEVLRDKEIEIWELCDFVSKNCPWDINNNIIHTQDIEISHKVDFEGCFSGTLKGLKNPDFLRSSPIQLKSIPLVWYSLDLIDQTKAGIGKYMFFIHIHLVYKKV